MHDDTLRYPAISGVVSAVTQVNGQTMLTIGNNQVPLSSITGVSETAPNTSAS